MHSHKPDSPRLTSLWEKAQRLRKVVLVGPRATHFPDQLAERAAVVGVDGGSALAERRLYDLTVGDGDSLPGGVQELDLPLPVDKDWSDLAFALSCLPQVPVELDLWGFSGGRWDHELANLGEISRHLAKSGGHALLHLEGNAAVHAFSPGQHQLVLRGTFSVFALYPTHLSLGGACRFPLAPTLVEPLSSLTLSNSGSGEVWLTGDQVFFCYQEGAIVR